MLIDYLPFSHAFVLRVVILLVPNYRGACRRAHY